MKICKSILWYLLLDTSGVDFAFNENYVFALTLFIISLLSMITTIIVSYNKEKAKTERSNKSEEELTKRIENANSESTRQLEIIKDIIFKLIISMPPEVQQKQNNDKIVFLNDIINERTKNIVAGGNVEKLTLSYKNNQSEKKEDEKEDSEKNNIDINAVGRALMSLLQNTLTTKDGNDGT